MPDTDDLKKTVDLDTSGPAMDVDVPETQEEEIVEQKETAVEEPAVRPVVEEKPEVKTESVTEEKKDDTELEQYSDSVQKRIAKLTKKWREAERQKDEALTYAQTVLKKQKDAESKLSKLQPDFVAVTEESITSGVAAAQAKLAAAREANDLTAEAEALASISELGYKKAKLAETKIAQEAYEKQQSEKKPEVNLNRQTAARGTPDPKAEAWSEKNSWFGKDTAMTYTAFDLHQKLTDEGFDPSSDEYYSEIDKRIRLEFPHKFGNNSDTAEKETTKPVQTVASAKRSTRSGRKTVRLTPSQVAIAKKLGVPLEEYAKQLNITKEA
tara:strand:- start:1739 stop:2716 length:978 start_codon:yes stop_codon:yes gene_type:complete